MIGRALDRLIGVFAPLHAARRIRARATLDNINTLLGTGQNAGYEGGQLNRLTSLRGGGQANENSIPREQIARLRYAAWHLYRNNPHARKIVRSLEAKVVGKCPRPQSQAVKADGTAHTEFRQRALALWRALGPAIDYRGRPGHGGQTLAGLHKTALRSVVLSGEVLWRYRRLSAAEQERKGAPVPLQLQLIHAERLDESVIRDDVFYGVELSQDDERLAYHILDRHPSDPRLGARMESRRVPAAEVGHLYAFEDVDQLRGVPWLAAAVMKMRGTDNYELSELTAAEMAACVVLGYRRSTGQSDFGVAGNDDWSLTDTDGNKISNVSPGMLLDLGKSGDIVGFNPQRPNANAADFIRHMVTSQAAAVPGIKGSTVHGDYRRASFASERAADNDVWPELEDLQEWYFSGFSQPLYEAAVTVGVESGWFDGVAGFSLADFARRKAEYLAATWQGPVARSINPVDDAEASKARIAGGQSTPQREAALVGADWREILAETAEYIEAAEAAGIPADIINQVLGIYQNDAGPDALAAQEAGQPADGADDGDESEEGGEAAAAA